jgi:hypothetical protein
MNQTKPIFALICIVFCLHTISYAQGKELAQHVTPVNKDAIADSLNNGIQFEYQVITKHCGRTFFSIKPIHSVINNNIEIQFAKGGACQHICQLQRNNDTLTITNNCVPDTQMKHKACYLINCKISGLKKGVYYLNYEGCKNAKIEIK